MASTTVSAGALSYVDIAAHWDPNGRYHDFVNLASAKNDIFEDLLMRPANDGSTEKVDLITGLPSAEWFMSGQGLAASKGSVGQIRMVCGKVGSLLMMEAETLEDAEDKGAWDRMYRKEVKGHVEAIAIAMVKQILYGDLKANPLGFNGISKWFSRHTSNDRTIPAHSVIDGGATDSTESVGSIFLVNHSEDSVYGFYPQNAKNAGIYIGDLRLTDQPEKLRSDHWLQIYLQRFKMKMGLAVADWRKNGRYCNINRFFYRAAYADKDARFEAAFKFKSDLDLMIDRCVDDNEGRRRLYMDPKMWEGLRWAVSVLTSENAITEKQVTGKKSVREYRGVPVRINECQEVNEEIVLAAA